MQDPSAQTNIQVVGEEKVVWKIISGGLLDSSLVNAWYATDVVFSDLNKTFRGQSVHNIEKKG